MAMSQSVQSPSAPVRSVVEGDVSSTDPTVGVSVDAPPSAAQGDVLEQEHPFDRPLAILSWSDPFRWLAAGWHDFTRAPLIGLFYGACFALMGWALLAALKFAPAYTLALSAGFLLMGPFMCLGLYHASRALERGLQPSLALSMVAWRRKGSAMATFGFILLIVEMLWGRSAMVVFAVSFDGMPDFGGGFAQLLTPDYLPFVVTYLAVGSVFAGLIFGISVISMPMIMDESVDAISAGLTSLRLVLTQPGVMLLWGLLLSLVVLAGMLPGFIGLLVAGPVVGHASWHAYRAATRPAP
jgi:uncharacterized membrane protein